MGIIANAVAALIGRPTQLRADVVCRYPELSEARWRVGGLPPRVGGWCLGQSTVSAITLWKTIWIAPGIEPGVELLLHELRHVQQFAELPLFPVLYLWQSVRHGYVRNRFEADARAYAAARVKEVHPNG